MSNLSPNEHSKDKKKSLLERFLNFANHTIKSNKKSSNNKKKIKKSPDFILISTTSKLENDIETCTFCDYCDKEIVAKFTGQHLIYHESCKKNNLEMLKQNDLNEFNRSSMDSSDLTLFATNETSLDNMNAINHRLSVSLQNLPIPFADDATLSSSSTISTYKFNKNRSNSTVRRNSVLTCNVDTYTFSTVDLSTIKQYGISIKKLPSIREKSTPPKFSQNKEKEVISKPNNNLDNITLPNDLTYLIDIFNDNDQGLLIEETDGKIMGKVRVYINLIRPIKMLLTARPPSIFEQYDDIDKDKSTIQRAYYNKEAIFWLPRGTTKLVYISLNCPTEDLISMLLMKFNIQNNPKKFALYEHTIASTTEVEVRKLSPKQFPLEIMLKWCIDGKEEYGKNLSKKRFVLQENDPGCVEWDDFYIPELNSFLKILMQEEQEKKNQITLRYEAIRKEIERCMKNLSADHHP